MRRTEVHDEIANDPAVMRISRSRAAQLLAMLGGQKTTEV